MQQQLFFLSEFLPLWGLCDLPAQLPLLPTKQALPPHIRTVIMAAFPYLLPEAHYPGRNISRYAVGADYHEVCGLRLQQACTALEARYPGELFAHYCDHSPLPEVSLAQQAGLGVQGRHNLLITREYGTWVFLGEIVTTAALPLETNCPPPVDFCRNCAAPCIAACPVNALGGVFDKTRCLSYRSQRKGPLDPEAAAALRHANSAWGCDLCQEACVRNIRPRVNPLPEFLATAQPHLTMQTPLDDRAYAWRGREVLTRNLHNLE